MYGRSLTHPARIQERAGGGNHASLNPQPDLDSDRLRHMRHSLRYPRGLVLMAPLSRGTYRETLTEDEIGLLAAPLRTPWQCAYCGAHNAGCANFCHACLKPAIKYVFGVVTSWMCMYLVCTLLYKGRLCIFVLCALL